MYTVSTKSEQQNNEGSGFPGWAIAVIVVSAILGLLVLWQVLQCLEKCKVIRCPHYQLSDSDALQEFRVEIEARQLQELISRSVARQEQVSNSDARQERISDSAIRQGRMLLFASPAWHRDLSSYRVLCSAQSTAALVELKRILLFFEEVSASGSVVEPSQLQDVDAGPSGTHEADATGAPLTAQPSPAPVR